LGTIFKGEDFPKTDVLKLTKRPMKMEDRAIFVFERIQSIVRLSFDYHTWDNPTPTGFSQSLFLKEFSQSLSFERFCLPDANRVLGRSDPGVRAGIPFTLRRRGPWLRPAGFWVAGGPTQS
jgi:hypothetical protein